MGGKVFLDTNILLRSTVKAFPQYRKIQTFVAQYLTDDSELWISRQVIREYLVQTMRPQSFMNPMTPEQAIQQVQSIEQVFKIADETGATTRTLLQLIASYPMGGKQIHDANIVATMMTYNIDRLITLNTADFARFAENITLISPLETDE